MSPSAAEQVRTVRATSRLSRVRGPLLLAGGVTAATVALHLRDPHQAGSWGLCPLYAATGVYCPGCGGLRAVNDLTNGDLAGAASSNLLFVAAIPVVVVLWALWTRSRWRGDPKPFDVGNPYVLSAVVVVLVVAFTVVRNLPSGSWLAP